MRVPTLLAQATDTPESGASRAEDFQPPTQNPQVPANTQQQDGQLQQTGDQDILSSPNARITVPVNPAPPQPTPQVATAQVNWLMIVVVTAALAVVFQVFVRAKRSKSSLGKVYIETEATPAQVEKPAPSPPTKAAPAKKPATKKKPAKKSRSKTKSKKR
jgi:hypothetical protein